MRVLVVTQYFPPETGGPQNRLASLVEGLSREGHDVTVLTAKPSYPQGVVFDGYEDGWFVDSVYDGVPVIHSWVLPDENKTTLRRILFYVSFVATSVLASFRTGGRADVVLASSPPLTVGVAGWIISRLEGARYVFDVRDLWPDVAEAMGELSGGWMTRMARAVEKSIYRRADGITAVTDGFCRDIQRRAGDDTPVERVTNGTDPEVFRVDAPMRELRDELDLPGGFLATYAGNIGLAQGLPHLLDAAEILRERGDDVTLLLVGDGPLRDRLQHEASERDLGGVLAFRNRVPLETAARYMAASDALLVPLEDRPIFGKFIPSKLFDAMAAGRPVLLSVDGEAREIMEEAGAGLYYPAEDAAGLITAIEELRASDRREEMGRQGRSYVVEHFTRDEQARKMAEFLDRITRGASSGSGGSGMSHATSR